MLLRLDSFISWLVQTKGPDLYRSKGVWRPSGSDDSVNLILGSFLPTAAKHRRLHRTAKSKATPTTKVLAVHGMPQKFVFHAVHMQQLSSRSAVWNSRWILDPVRFLYRGMTQADLANKVPIEFWKDWHCNTLYHFSLFFPYLQNPNDEILESQLESQLADRFSGRQHEAWGPDEKRHPVESWYQLDISWSASWMLFLKRNCIATKVNIIFTESFFRDRTNRIMCILSELVKAVQDGLHWKEFGPRRPKQKVRWMLGEVNANVNALRVSSCHWTSGVIRCFETWKHSAECGPMWLRWPRCTASIGCSSVWWAPYWSLSKPQNRMLFKPNSILYIYIYRLYTPYSDISGVSQSWQFFGASLSRRLQAN